MKKSMSYVLPLAALAILGFLAFRWLRSEPGNPGSISPTAESAEGIEISDLTGNESKPTGMVDTQRVKLTQTTPSETPEQGEVRYSKTDDNATRFTVSADLPELKDNSSFYQLWMEGDKGRKKAMKLSFEKGGYVSEGVLSSNFDEVKIIISKETKDDDQMEEVQLEGTINLKK
ncbi:MAG: hypothetical protein ABI425_05215 [Patescibacteria group bacterium]